MVMVLSVLSPIAQESVPVRGVTWPARPKSVPEIAVPFTVDHVAVTAVVVGPMRFTLMLAALPSVMVYVGRSKRRPRSSSFSVTVETGLAPMRVPVPVGEDSCTVNVRAPLRMPLLRIGIDTGCAADAPAFQLRSPLGGVVLPRVP